jgi:hypothetical protein
MTRTKNTARKQIRRIVSIKFIHPNGRVGYISCYSAGQSRVVDLRPKNPRKKRTPKTQGKKPVLVEMQDIYDIETVLDMLRVSTFDPSKRKKPMLVGILSRVEDISTSDIETALHMLRVSTSDPSNWNVIAAISSQLNEELEDRQKKDENHPENKDAYHNPMQNQYTPQSLAMQSVKWLQNIRALTGISIDFS